MTDDEPETTEVLESLNGTIKQWLPDGALLNGFVLVADYSDPETGKSCPFEVWDHEQHWFMTLGLLRAAEISIVEVLREQGDL